MKVSLFLLLFILPCLIEGFGGFRRRLLTGRRARLGLLGGRRAGLRALLGGRRRGLGLLGGRRGGLGLSGGRRGGRGGFIRVADKPDYDTYYRSPRSGTLYQVEGVEKNGLYGRVKLEHMDRPDAPDVYFGPGVYSGEFNPTERSPDKAYLGPDSQQS